MNSHRSQRLVAIQIRRVERTMGSHYDPLGIVVVSRLSKIVLEEYVLGGSLRIVVFGGEVHEVDLTVVEGEPEVIVASFRLGEAIPVSVGGVVVVPFVVSHSGHEGCGGGPLFCLLAEEVPDGLHFTHLLRVHPCIGNVSIEEYKVQRVVQMVLVQSVGNLMSHWSVCAHIPEHPKADSGQNSPLVGRRDKSPGLRVGQEHAVPHLVVVFLLWIQPLHYSCVDPAVKAKMSRVVSRPSRICSLVQLVCTQPVLHTRLVELVRGCQPHHLHLSILPSETQMHLLRPPLPINIRLGKLQHLFQSDHTVEVGVVVIEGLPEVCRVDVHLWLDILVVGDPVLEVEPAIPVDVVGGVEELFEGLPLDLAESCSDQNDQDDNPPVDHLLSTWWLGSCFIRMRMWIWMND